MRIEDILDQIEHILESGKNVVLTNKTMVDAEAIKTAIEDIRLNIPTEIKQARAIAADRKVILTKAQSEGEAIIQRAHDVAADLVAENEITKKAKATANEIMAQAQANAKETIENAKNEAEKIMDQANQWSQDMRTSASNFVEEIMKNADDVMTSGVNEIRRARQSLKIAASRKSDE